MDCKKSLTKGGRGIQSTLPLKHLLRETCLPAWLPACLLAWLPGLLASNIIVDLCRRLPTTRNTFNFPFLATNFSEPRW